MLKFYDSKANAFLVHPIDSGAWLDAGYTAEPPTHKKPKSTTKKVKPESEVLPAPIESQQVNDIPMEDD